MFEEEYNSYDEIPDAVKHLYTEKDGKYVLLARGEVKSVEDVNRLQDSLRKEREDHKSTKRKWAPLNDHDPEEILKNLDRIEELESASGGNIDESKIDELVEKRLKTRVAPLERQVKTLEEERNTLTQERDQFKQKDERRDIHDHIRKAAVKANLRETAIEDALIIGERIFERDENGNVVSKDGVGVTPGVDPTVWLSDVKETRPHWWPESSGSGARGGDGGSGGSNPFTAENWNLTEQGRLVKENPQRAEQMAKSAGTTVGGGKPQKASN